MKNKLIILFNLFITFSLHAEIPNALKLVQKKLIDLAENKNHKITERNLSENKFYSLEIILESLDGYDFIKFYYVIDKGINPMFPITLKAETHEVSRVGAIICDFPIVSNKNNDLILLENENELWKKVYFYSGMTNIQDINPIIISIDLAKSNETKMRKIIEVIEPLMKNKIELENNLLKKTGSLSQILADHITALNVKYSDALWNVFCSNSKPEKDLIINVKSDNSVKIEKLDDYYKIRKNNKEAILKVIKTKNPQDFFYRKNQLKSWANGIILPLLEFNIGEEINGKIFITKTLNSNEKNYIKDNSYLMVLGRNDVTIFQNINMTTEDFVFICEKITNERLNEIWQSEEKKDISKLILKSFYLSSFNKSEIKSKKIEPENFVFENNEFKFELKGKISIERLLKSRQEKTRKTLNAELKNAKAGEITINRKGEKIGHILIVCDDEKNTITPVLGQIANYYLMNIGYINLFFSHFKKCKIENWQGIINTETQIDKKFNGLSVPLKEAFFQDVKLIISNGNVSMLISTENEFDAQKIAEILIDKYNKK